MTPHQINIQEDKNFLSKMFESKKIRNRMKNMYCVHQFLHSMSCVVNVRFCRQKIFQLICPQKSIRFWHLHVGKIGYSNNNIYRKAGESNSFSAAATFTYLDSLRAALFRKKFRGATCPCNDLQSLWIGGRNEIDLRKKRLLPIPPQLLHESQSDLTFRHGCGVKSNVEILPKLFDKVKISSRTALSGFEGCVFDILATKNPYVRA